MTTVLEPDGRLAGILTDGDLPALDGEAPRSRLRDARGDGMTKIRRPSGPRPGQRGPELEWKKEDYVDCRVDEAKGVLGVLLSHDLWTSGVNVEREPNAETEEMDCPSEGRRFHQKLARRAKQILVLLMDVDGTTHRCSVTLTVAIGWSGLELKNFDAHEASGLTPCRFFTVTAGLRTRCHHRPREPGAARRCKNWTSSLSTRSRGKDRSLRDVLRKTGAKESEVAFLGDDPARPDVMSRVGLAVAVITPPRKLAHVPAHYTHQATAVKAPALKLVEIILKIQVASGEEIDRQKARALNAGLLSRTRCATGRSRRCQLGSRNICAPYR